MQTVTGTLINASVLSFDNKVFASSLNTAILPFAVGVGAPLPESFGKGVVVNLQFGDL